MAGFVQQLTMKDGGKRKSPCNDLKMSISGKKLFQKYDVNY